MDKKDIPVANKNLEIKKENNGAKRIEELQKLRPETITNEEDIELLVLHYMKHRQGEYVDQLFAAHLKAQLDVFGRSEDDDKKRYGHRNATGVIDRLVAATDDLEFAMSLKNRDLAYAAIYEVREKHLDPLRFKIVQRLWNLARPAIDNGSVILHLHRSIKEHRLWLLELVLQEPNLPVQWLAEAMARLLTQGDYEYVEWGTPPSTADVQYGKAYWMLLDALNRSKNFLGRFE